MKKVRSLIIVSFILIFIPKIFSQTTNPAPYCNAPYWTVPSFQPNAPNTPGNFVNDFINGFYTTGAAMDISNLNSGCPSNTTNYIYYCQHNLSVNPGQIISCNLQSSDIQAQGYVIFIDWDQNNTFDVPTERVAASPSVSPAGTWSAINFTVPAGQSNGIYRMRIRSVWNSPGAGLMPCDQYNYGETEDYNVYVGISAPAAPTFSCNSPLCAGQTLSLSVNYNGLVPAATYSWQSPNGFFSFIQNPQIPNINPVFNNVYNVTVSIGSCLVKGTLSPSVISGPTIQPISIPGTVCVGSSATITATGANSYTWNPGGPGLSIVVSPTVTTTYTVTGSNGGACTGTAVLTQQVDLCSGLDEPDQLTKNFEYPNPFTNELIIKVSTKTEIELFNSLGQIIIRRFINSEESINTESLSKGIYYLSYYPDGNRKVVKVIKN